MPNSFNETALIIAAQCNPSCMPVLLKAGADVNIRGISGYTAYTISVQQRLFATMLRKLAPA